MIGIAVEIWLQKCLFHDDYQDLNSIWFYYLTYWVQYDLLELVENEVPPQDAERVLHKIT